MRRAIEQADALQSFSRLRRGPRHAGVLQRQLDVRLRARAGEQVEALEDEADVAVAHLGALVVGERRDVAAGEPVGARRGAIEAAEDVQQRRFSAARWPDDRDGFALSDPEAHARDGANRELAALRVVGLGQRLDLDDRRCVGHRGPLGIPKGPPAEEAAGFFVGVSSTSSPAPRPSSTISLLPSVAPVRMRCLPPPGLTA